MQSGFKTERHRQTTSSFGTEMPISCARAWKPFSRLLPSFLEQSLRNPMKLKNPSLAVRSRIPPHTVLRRWRSLRQPKTFRSDSASHKPEIKQHQRGESEMHAHVSQNRSEYRDVPLTALTESASNPRKRFDENSLSELAAY